MQLWRKETTMKDFIERVRNAYNYEWHWDKEPLFFKTFVVVVVLISLIVKAIYCIVAAITIPVWIVPYIIYTYIRNRRGEG